MPAKQKVALNNLRKFDGAGRIMELDEGLEAVVPCSQCAAKKDEGVICKLYKDGREKSCAYCKRYQRGGCDASASARPPTIEERLAALENTLGERVAAVECPLQERVTELENALATAHQRINKLNKELKLQDEKVKQQDNVIAAIRTEQEDTGADIADIMEWMRQYSSQRVA